MSSRVTLRRTWSYFWASPNTLVGLACALVGLAFGGSLRWRAGVCEAHGPVLAWLLRHATLVRGGAWALTLGHVVLGRDAAALAATRAHERVHVGQYERWGPLFLPAYGLASLWARRRGGDGYHDNVFERAARRGAGEE